MKTAFSSKPFWGNCPEHLASIIQARLAGREKPHLHFSAAYAPHSGHGIPSSCGSMGHKDKGGAPSGAAYCCSIRNGVSEQRQHRFSAHGRAAGRTGGTAFPPEGMEGKRSRWCCHGLKAAKHCQGPMAAPGCRHPGLKTQPALAGVRSGGASSGSLFSTFRKDV